MATDLYVVMAYIGMAHIVMAYIVMAVCRGVHGYRLVPHVAQTQWQQPRIDIIGRYVMISNTLR